MSAKIEIVFKEPKNGKMGMCRESKNYSHPTIFL